MFLISFLSYFVQALPENLVRMTMLQRLYASNNKLTFEGKLCYTFPSVLPCCVNQLRYYEGVNGGRQTVAYRFYFFIPFSKKIPMFAVFEAIFSHHLLGSHYKRPQLRAAEPKTFPKSPFLEAFPWEHVWLSIGLDAIRDWKMWSLYRPSSFLFLLPFFLIRALNPDHCLFIWHTRVPFSLATYISVQNQGTATRISGPTSNLLPFSRYSIWHR